VITITELPAQPLWATMRTLKALPESVAVARRFTAQYLTDRAKLTDGHVDDVVLVVSELVSNALQHAKNAGRNISLDVAIWSKWTVITVDDRDPAVYETGPVASDGPRESGRGLEQIVKTLAERFWWRTRTISKTANAVILRPGVNLTDEDNTILDHLERNE
jgi:anti-sigma regulatory factor (Ser/Thr protein kinase)